MFGGGFPFGDMPGMGGFPGGMGGGPSPRRNVDNSKYYKLLQVEKDCSEADLKKAHRKAAMKHHPDKGGDEATFRDINEAYDVLKDPEKRKVYDQFGEEGIKEGMGSGGGGGGGFADIFDMMNGGRGRGGAPRQKKSENIEHKLKVSLDECYNGSTRKLQLSRKNKCATCNGAGSKSGRSTTCGKCRGQGVVIQLRQLGPGMVQQVQCACPECNGSGESVPASDRCGSCHGKKLISEKKVFEVPIEKGHGQGSKITLRGEAGYTDPSALPGDIIFHLEMKDHSVFKRKGDNLFYEKELQLVEALCGCKFVIKQLDGRELLIESVPGEVIKPGEYKAVRDEGMPIYGNSFEKGSLFIHFTVAFPSKVQSELGAQLKGLLMTRGSAENMISDEAEECTMQKVDVEQEIKMGARGGHAAYAEDDDDDDDDPRMGGAGGQRVQCAQQ